MTPALSLLSKKFATRPPSPLAGEGPRRRRGDEGAREARLNLATCLKVIVPITQRVCASRAPSSVWLRQPPSPVGGEGRAQDTTSAPS